MNATKSSYFETYPLLSLYMSYSSQCNNKSINFKGMSEALLMHHQEQAHQGVASPQEALSWHHHQWRCGSSYLQVQPSPQQPQSHLLQ